MLTCDVWHGTCFISFIGGVIPCQQLCCCKWGSKKLRKLEFHLFLFEMQLVLMTLIFDGFEFVEVNAADMFEVRPELIARLFLGFKL